MLSSSYLILSVVAILAIACGSDDGADQAPTAVYIEGDCFRMSEQADCPDDSSVIDISLGVSARLEEMPPLPDGLIAVSRYFVFESEEEDTGRQIGLALNEPAPSAEELGWYSYEGGEWNRLDISLTLADEGTVAEGTFESLPASLAVLREE